MYDLDQSDNVLLQWSEFELKYLSVADSNSEHLTPQFQGLLVVELPAISINITIPQSCIPFHLRHLQAVQIAKSVRT